MVVKWRRDFPQVLLSPIGWVLNRCGPELLTFAFLSLVSVSLFAQRDDLSATTPEKLLHEFELALGAGDAARLRQCFGQSTRSGRAVSQWMVETVELVARQQQLLAQIEEKFPQDRLDHELRALLASDIEDLIPLSFDQVAIERSETGALVVLPPADGSVRPLEPVDVVMQLYSAQGRWFIDADSLLEPSELRDFDAVRMAYASLSEMVDELERSLAEASVFNLFNDEAAALHRHTIASVERALPRREQRRPCSTEAESQKAQKSVPEAQYDHLAERAGLSTSYVLVHVANHPLGPERTAFLASPTQDDIVVLTGVWRNDEFVEKSRTLVVGGSLSYSLPGVQSWELADAVLFSVATGSKEGFTYSFYVQSGCQTEYVGALSYLDNRGYASEFTEAVRVKDGSVERIYCGEGDSKGQTILTIHQREVRYNNVASGLPGEVPVWERDSEVEVSSHFLWQDNAITPIEDLCANNLTSEVIFSSIAP